VSLSKRPPILEQQNDRTIELRQLADAAQGVEWDDEEPTRPGMTSSPEIHIHMTKHPTPKPTAEPEPEANEAPLPVPARIAKTLLDSASTWPKVVALAAILAFVGYLLTHGVKLPW
jgi:hypothetical protein